MTTVKVVTVTYKRVAIDYHGVRFVQYFAKMRSKAVNLAFEAVNRDKGRYMKAIAGDSFAKQANGQRKIRTEAVYDPKPLTLEDRIRLDNGIPAKCPISFKP